MKQGPGRDGVRGGTPSASGMSGGSRRYITYNKYNPNAAAGRDYQNRVSIAVKNAKKAAGKVETERMLRLQGRGTTPTKKNSIPTNTDMNRMTERSLQRKSVNQKINQAKAGTKRFAAGAAGAAGVGAALPKRKASGAEGPKRSMPRGATKPTAKKGK